MTHGPKTFAYFRLIEQMFDLEREATKIYREVLASGFLTQEADEEHTKIVATMDALNTLLAAAKADAQEAWDRGAEIRPQTDCLRIESRIEQSEAALYDAQQAAYAKLREAQHG
jgi:hypothetical protein